MPAETVKVPVPVYGAVPPATLTVMVVLGVEQFNAKPCVAVTVRVGQAGLTNEPGEPISFASLKALNAPFTPTALS